MVAANTHISDMSGNCHSNVDSSEKINWWTHLGLWMGAHSSRVRCRKPVGGQRSKELPRGVEQYEPQACDGNIVGLDSSWHELDDMAEQPENRERATQTRTESDQQRTDMASALKHVLTRTAAAKQAKQSLRGPLLRFVLRRC